MAEITATPEEAEELRKVVVSGVQTVESDDRRVTYRSLDDLLRVLGQATVETPGAASKTRRRYVAFSKGWQR